MRSGCREQLGERLPGLPEALESFAERLELIVGPERVAGVLATLQANRRTAYVLNSLAPATESEPAPEPMGVPVPGVDGCFAVEPLARSELLSRAAVREGLWYPMNPSSVIAARALGAAPGHEVLDLAAAPGGKTLILAMAMGNQGRLAAVEVVKARFFRMRANLKRLGVRNVRCYLADGRGIGRKVPARFDRVLLDAPCSSEARIRPGDPASYRYWKLRKIRESAAKQRRLIRSAFQALKPGGEMIYSTCTFAPEENEAVVSALLAREPDAELLPLAECLPPEAPAEPGLASWQGKRFDDRVTLTRRILPDDLYEGFFIARIGKR